MMRRDLPPDQREVLFGAAPGALVGPIPLAHGVLGISAATRDEDARERAKRVLFDEWLDGRRRAARIEWQWRRASES